MKRDLRQSELADLLAVAVTCRFVLKKHPASPDAPAIRALLLATEQELARRGRVKTADTQ